MSKNRAIKMALQGYAATHKIALPTGFNARSDSFGAPAFELTRRVQKDAGLKSDGAIGPYTLLAIGKHFPGRVGQRAMWSMISLVGPLETGGNNLGPSVQAVQKLGSELNPGAWPWCAATTSWALRCAGWEYWGTFVRNEPEAWVQGWVNAARAGRHGMRAVHWSIARPGDFICMMFDGSEPYDHIGIVRSRPRVTSGTILTAEGNTSNGDMGSQADGGGLWLRERAAGKPTLFIRVD